MEALFADTYEELMVAMLGFHHDHCYHYYHGYTDNVPGRFDYLVTENKKFIFIYEETKPFDYDTKISSSEN